MRKLLSVLIVIAPLSCPAYDMQAQVMGFRYGTQLMDSQPLRLHSVPIAQFEHKLDAINREINSIPYANDEATHMTGKPQFTCTLLPNNEVRFWSLSRKAKVKPEYLPMSAERYHSQEAVTFAVDHYRKTGRILLHSEVNALLRKRKSKNTPQYHALLRRHEVQHEFRM